MINTVREVGTYSANFWQLHSLQLPTSNSESALRRVAWSSSVCPHFLHSFKSENEPFVACSIAFICIFDLFRSISKSSSGDYSQQDIRYQFDYIALLVKSKIKKEERRLTLFGFCSISNHCTKKGGWRFEPIQY